MGLATRSGNGTIRAIGRQSSIQADRRNRRRKLSRLAELDLASLQSSSRTTWHYRSFLRTTPCIEGVAWIISDAPHSVSAAQITAFSPICPCNRRPMQPLGERVLYRR